MLRENLDTVLKELLEFKTKIPCKYPGSNLDLKDNFLLTMKDSTAAYSPEGLDSVGSHSKELLNNLAAEEYRYSPIDKEKTQIVYRIRRYLNKKSKQVMKPISSIKNKFRRYFSRKNKLKNVKEKRLSNKSDSMPKNNALREEKSKKFLMKSEQIRNGRRLMAYKEMYRRRKERETTLIVGKKIIPTTMKSKTVTIISEGDPADGDAALKARFLFKSCMNYEILEKRAHQPLVDLLDLLGGWPILKPTWNSTKFDWLELMAKLRLYNNDILISEWVGPDIKNSDEFVIQFDQTSLGSNFFFCVLCVCLCKFTSFTNDSMCNCRITNSGLFPTRIK